MRTARIVGLLTAAALLGAGAHALALAGLPIVAAKALQLRSPLPSDADIDKPFERPLPATLEAAAGRQPVQLTSCRDYLAQRTRIVGSSTDADFRVLRYQGVRCEALALLRHAVPAQRSRIPASLRGMLSTRDYPATLWAAVSDEETAELTKPGATLRSASGQAAFRSLAGDVLELRTGDMTLRLTLLARGDFNHDGWEDLALRWEAHATQGSYADTKLVVLTRTGPQSLLRELPVNDLLRDR